MRNLIILALSLLAAAITTNAHAMPVTYDESIDGDIGNFTNSGIIAQTLALGVGLNTVTGSIGVTDDDTDDDPFFFTLAQGLEIVGISFAVTNVEIQNDSFESLFANLNLTQFNSSGFSFAGATFSLLDPTLPLVAMTMFDGEIDPNIVLDAFVGFGGSFSGDARFLIDYVVSVEVRELSEVPLPAAAWVFLAGLGGLGVTRRRKKGA